ncbi:MAG TPA: S8 family serine peptidase [Flavobacterium sp.]|nr:S8 family serine peptidase [Flavobacterium sp.]
MKKIYFLLLLFCSFSGISQEDAWVYFTNKPDADFFLQNPLEMLSQRALDRRTTQNIALDLLDVPIAESYKSQIAAQPGITIMAQSKWMNCLHIRGTQAAIEALTSLSFVSSIQFANPTLNQSGRMASTNKEATATKNLDIQVDFSYGGSLNQVQMLGGDLLHQQNFTGNGKIIAVMDNGFPGVNTTQPFQRLRDNNLILGGYDFVDRDEDVYDGGTHGTMVLSTMGGFKEAELVGTAPDAAYYLFKTEANTYENPLEESLWVEATELADSLGVDVINTSLGYSTFDNPAYNYSYADMNGITTFIARGADLAFSRGMICVTSAGNSGNSSWQYISTPADAINTLAVGAVNASGVYASFSSIGPSSDGRVKPDVDAQGVSSTVATSNGSIANANGTSFSGPITAGMVACLWQALPTKTNAELIQLVKESAHLYQNPTAQLGYGIPNFNAALMNALAVNDFETTPFMVYPNPFQDEISIFLDNKFEKAQLELFSVLGQKIKTFSVSGHQTFDVTEVASGIYFYQITAGNNTFSGKLIKK